MQVSMEALLGKLLEVERDAYFADLPQDTTEDVTALHKAIIEDSLTNVKNFMSSFGISAKDFFDQDKSRFSIQPIKGGKGGKGDQYPALKERHLENLPTGQRNLILCQNKEEQSSWINQSSSHLSLWSCINR